MNSFREWLNTLFGSDGGRAVQMLFALLLVVLLILAVTWLFRRLFGAALHRGRSNRLSMVDSTVIDQHRRLLLLRRDDVEHLVMIGGPNDLLVESRILKAAPVLAGRPVAPQAVARPHAAPAPFAEPPLGAEGDTSPAPAPVEAVRAKAVAGAATVAAAVASAGALLRSRLSRAEEPAPLARAPGRAAEAPRRTLDDAFDAPLGRALDEPASAAVPPPPPPPVPSARLAAALEADRLAKSLARQAAEPVEPAPQTVAAPERPAPTIRSIEIDLLADLEAIDAEIPPAPSPAPEIRVEAAAPIDRAPAVAAPEPEPVAVEEPHFDFDFDFSPRSEPAPSVEAPEIEIVRAEPEPIVEPEEPIVETEPFVEPEPFAELEPFVEPRPEPTDVPVVTSEPEPELTAEPEAEKTAPPVAPPPPRSAVDELEEEMARLLAELSGQTRR